MDVQKFTEHMNAVVEFATTKFQNPAPIEFAQAMVYKRVSAAVAQGKTDAEIVYDLSGVEGSAIAGFGGHINDAWVRHLAREEELKNPQAGAKEFLVAMEAQPAVVNWASKIS